jgi:hypothetical protein
MKNSRFFGPGFVAAVGPYFVAVDTVQPVAVVVSQQGAVMGVESWEQLVAPPAESPWPNRRFGVGPDSLLVQDLPDGDVVSLRISPEGTVETSLVPASAFMAERVLVRHPRMIAAPRGNSIEAGWRFVSDVHRCRRSAKVEFRSDNAAWTMPVGRGSIVAAARHGRVAAICVRRADQCPWEFDPAYQLCVVRAGAAGTIELTEVPPIDITRRCWPREVDPADLVELVRSYMGYAIGGCRVAVKHGGRDVRLELRQVDSDPVIELSFELPSVPGVRLVRIDRPVNELGHLAGLRSLTVYLEEDLAGSNVVEVLLEDVGPVDGRLYF